MSSEKISASRRCPNCGAELKGGARECWLCRDEVSFRAGTPEDEERERKLLERITLPDAEPRSEFGASAVLGILAIIVCFGLAMSAPGVLIVLLVAATPALIRMIFVGARESGEAPLTAGGLAGIFFSTLGIIVMVGLASFAAFYATCFLVCLGMIGGRGVNNILSASVGAGTVVGLLVALLLFLRFWPRRR